MFGNAIGEVMLAEGGLFSLSPDGRRMIAVKSDGHLHLHHVDGNRDMLNLSILGISLSEFTSDGNKIIGISNDGIVRVLDGTPWEEK
jgi:WD40 repeat protein